MFEKNINHINSTEHAASHIHRIPRCFIHRNRKTQVRHSSPAPLVGSPSRVQAFDLID